MNTVPTASIRWDASASLVHAIPRDVETGNRTLISARTQRELEETKHQLKIRPNDASLLQRKKDLMYDGLVSTNYCAATLQYCFELTMHTHHHIFPGRT